MLFLLKSPLLNGRCGFSNCLQPNTGHGVTHCGQLKGSGEWHWNIPWRRKGIEIPNSAEACRSNIKCLSSKAMQCHGEPLSDGDERQPCSGLTRLKHAVKELQNTKVLATLPTTWEHEQTNKSDVDLRTHHLAARCCKAQVAHGFPRFSLTHSIENMLKLLPPRAAVAVWAPNMPSGGSQLLSQATRPLRTVWTKDPYSRISRQKETDKLLFDLFVWITPSGYSLKQKIWKYMKIS